MPHRWHCLFSQPYIYALYKTNSLWNEKYDCNPPHFCLAVVEEMVVCNNRFRIKGFCVSPWTNVTYPIHHTVSNGTFCKPSLPSVQGLLCLGAIGFLLSTSVMRLILYPHLPTWTIVMFLETVASWGSYRISRNHLDHLRGVKSFWYITRPIRDNFYERKK